MNKRWKNPETSEEVIPLPSWDKAPAAYTRLYCPRSNDASERRWRDSAPYGSWSHARSEKKTRTHWTREIVSPDRVENMQCINCEILSRCRSNGIHPCRINNVHFERSRSLSNAVPFVCEFSAYDSSVLSCRRTGSRSPRRSSGTLVRSHPATKYGKHFLIFFSNFLIF